MTWSAPSDRTSSTLRVPHTPVTSAPSNLAIWTAMVPTPPEAPLIRTRDRLAGRRGRGPACRPGPGVDDPLRRPRRHRSYRVRLADRTWPADAPTHRIG